MKIKQRRLSHQEKSELFKMYETGKYTGVDLAKIFNISSVATNALLRRHGYKAKTQSELQRKYSINETFFDIIDTQEKAYVLGLLYADGYNNTDRNSVSLGLKETDREILDKVRKITILDTFIFLKKHKTLKIFPRSTRKKDRTERIELFIINDILKFLK